MDLHHIQMRMDPHTYCQMSLSSVGAHSLSSVSTRVNPPTVNRLPPLLTRFRELLSWGKSGKSAHLFRRGSSSLRGSSSFSKG